MYSPLTKTAERRNITILSEFYKRQKLLINISSTILQVIVTGLLYYFLYKIILQKLGAELLGVWSIILATSSIASVGGGGFTTSLVKFLAEFYSTQKDTSKLLFTSFICSLCFYILFSIIVFLVAPFLLKYFINAKYLTLAINILPISLLILVINSITNFFLSILEGLQKNYIKNIVVSITNIIFLIATFLLLQNRVSLFSVINAQIIQSLSLMILAIAFSARYKSLNYFKKWNWCASTFKLLGSYSLKFQFISILQILYDPITKGLLGRFSGLQSVAYYEMSNRLISQIRNVIVNSNQVLVPVIASSKSTAGNSVENIYIKSFHVVSLVSLVSMVISVASCSYICFYWVGSFSRDFILCTTILSVSMFFNIISGPAYFGNIGEGTLKPLLYQHSFLAIANVFLALLLNFFGVLYGSVWAWGISLFLASTYMLLYYQRRKKIKFSDVLKREDYGIITFSIIVTILFCYLNNLEIKGISSVFMYLWLRIAILFSFAIFILLVKKQVLLELIKKRF